MPRILMVTSEAAPFVKTGGLADVLGSLPAALLAPYLRPGLAADPAFSGAKCVLTIHNLGYQGNFPASVLGDLGIDGAHFHPDGLEFFGRLSFLKAGIIWSDAITTVSPTYA